MKPSGITFNRPLVRLVVQFARSYARTPGIHDEFGWRITQANAMHIALYLARYLDLDLKAKTKGKK